MPFDTSITPRKHQGEAISAMSKELAQSDRALARLACGTGKTYIQALLSREMLALSDDRPPVIICLVPNRALVKQNADNFYNIFADSVDYIGFCSSSDALAARGLGNKANIRTTTNPDHVAEQLQKGDRPKIIFATYQSAQKLPEALKKKDGSDHAVMLGVFDEAHRAAGDKSLSSQFAFALSDSNIKMSKRAFFTATTRSHEMGSTETYLSMDDPSVFGERVYDYSYRAAVEDRQVADLHLKVPVVDLSEARRIARDAGAETDDNGEINESVLRAIAGEMALRAVTRETGQTRFLSYHSTIEGSKAFSERMAKTFGQAGYVTGHIDGSTSDEERTRLIEAMGKDKSVISNCKAFVEGVDSPGLQGVIFVDPKGSVVDLVQAIGRSTRTDDRDPEKMASIIVPVLFDSENDTEIAEQLAAGGYGPLLKVVEALKTSYDGIDDRRGAGNRAMDRALGRGETAADMITNIGFLDATSAGLNPQDLESLFRTVKTITLTTTIDRFAKRVGELEAYLAAHGEMPTLKTEAKLANWVTQIRKSHRDGKLADEDARLLDGLEGWSWIGPRDSHAAIAGHLQAFYERNDWAPDMSAKSSAERELGQKLFEFEGNPGLLDSTDRQRLYRNGILFGAKSQEERYIVGTFVRDETGGQETIRFIPHATSKSSPLFQTRHDIGNQSFLMSFSQDERERFEALGAQHNVALILEPNRDAPQHHIAPKITAWSVLKSVHDNEPETRSSVRYLVNRLKDRKAAGLGSLDDAQPESPCITLNKAAQQDTNAGLLALVRRARSAYASGKLGESVATTLDACPGFSWIDRADAKTLKASLDGLVKRHGADVLTSVEKRQGDNGLANSLREMDALVAADLDAPHKLSESLRAIMSEDLDRDQMRRLRVYARAAQGSTAQQDPLQDAVQKTKRKEIQEQL